MAIPLGASGCAGFLGAPLINKILAANGGNWRQAWQIIAGIMIVAGAIAILFVKERPELCVAMLILDTDLYRPTKAALENFLPLMPKGGIVVLDEVCYRNFAGETQALKEVLDLNKIELKRLPFDTSVGYFRV